MNKLIKVDLHVHSKYSDSPKVWFLEKVRARECWTEPESIYKQCLARDMDLITITDHDSIDGVKEILHHGPHVFMSQEISARFPENGCVAHVLAWDFSEDQHQEIQFLRYNIYDLVEYLRQEQILHALAHPLSAINNRLDAQIVQKMFLMFKNMELCNGPRDAYHHHALLEIEANLSREVLESWADMHQIEPVSWEPARSWVGGSDDHSGHAIARAYTVYDGEPTFASLRRALESGQTRTAGEFMTPESLGHTIYAGALNYFRENGHSAKGNVYAALQQSIQQGQMPLQSDPSHRLVTRAFDAFLEVSKEEQLSLPSAEDLLKKGNTEAIHSQIYHVAGRILHHMGKNLAGTMVDQIKNLRLNEAIYEIPAIGELVFLSIPYLIGFRYFYNDRNNAERIVKDLNLVDSQPIEPRVAIFTDTIDSVNGVSLSLRRLADQLNHDGHFVKILGLDGDQRDAIQSEQAGEQHIVRFEPLEQFPLFAYDDMFLGIPPFLAILDWVVRNRVTLIQVSTPGPMGLVALLISRLLGVRIVGNYHTQVPEYAERLTNDATVGRLARGFVRWFYGGLEQVISATNATRDYLIEMGLRADRIRVVPRGVDVEQFTPSLRSNELWGTYGLNGSTKLLYVGRVSKEKNLDHLMTVFDMLRIEGADIELAIVGDGPYRAELQERYFHEPRIVFTGFLEGRKLAQAYASADLFVFPSTTDTFGNVVLEAHASGLPAVVTDMGGPAEIVQHNKTGFIVPAGNLGLFKKAIQKLIMDPERLEKMSSSARLVAELRCYRTAAVALWSVYAESCSVAA